jgi:hypothetical protein
MIKKAEVLSVPVRLKQREQLRAFVRELIQSNIGINADGIPSGKLVCKMTVDGASTEEPDPFLVNLNAKFADRASPR